MDPLLLDLGLGTHPCCEPRAHCRPTAEDLRVLGVKTFRTEHANTDLTRPRHRQHGHSDSPTYRSWCAMRSRCTNPHRRDWPRYGGRGITVCPRWASFANFLADMGERPAGMTLDRIDNDLGYCTDNCRWSTPREQANNRARPKGTP